jgi:hypothetical protein
MIAQSAAGPRRIAWSVAAYGVVSTVLARIMAEVATGAPSDLHLPRTFVFSAESVAFGLPAALIIARQPANPVGWILAWITVVAGITDLSAGYAAFALYGPGLPGGEYAAWLFSWTYAWVIGPAATLLFLFFPNGRLPSPAWRPTAWLAVLATLGFGLGYALLPAPMPIFVSTQKPLAAAGAGTVMLDLLSISVVLFLFTAVASAASLFIRARTATTLERQQLKWLAFAAAIVTVTSVVVLTLGSSLVIGAELVTYALLAIPIAIGLAVVRYRLYDIDVVIRRTLVYGGLSALLLMTYAAAVVLLQTALRPVTTGSELSVAGSTLVVVALFHPLRRRAQNAVDRRFYRSRYDAARTLDAFTARLRDQVDIDAVRDDVLEVVGTTLRPAHASVWLRRTIT